MYGPSSELLAASAFANPSQTCNETNPAEDQVLCDKGEFIKKISQSLNDIFGFSLAEDGFDGVRTQEAVREVQRRNGLPMTGEVDGLTRQLILMNSNRTRRCPSQQQDAQRTVRRGDCARPRDGRVPSEGFRDS